MNILSRCFKIVYCVLILSIQLFTYADTYRFGVMGDAGLWNKNTKNVHDSLQRHNIKQLVMPGDNIYANPIDYPSYESVWDKWRAEGFKFDVVAIGNHNTGYENEIKYFNMPGETYSITYNNFVQFIVLNSDNETTFKTQAQFLEKELAATTAPYVFLVYHHPSYSLSFFHPASEKFDFQNAIRPLFTQYRNKITALLVGHDHVSVIAHFNNLPVILSGSTHEQRLHIPLNYTDKSVKVKTNWFNDRDALWGNLQLDTEKDFAQLDFVRGYDDKNVCTVMLKTGVEAGFASNCKL